MKKSNRELFISNTVFNVSFKLVNQVIALFILPLFVKNLGAELYGIWVISGIVIGYFGMVDLCGIPDKGVLGGYRVHR